MANHEPRKACPSIYPISYLRSFLWARFGLMLLVYTAIPVLARSAPAFA